MIAINMISLYAKPSIGKTSGHNNRIYYDNHLSFFNIFYLILFLKNIPVLNSKRFRSIYCISHISICYSQYY